MARDEDQLHHASDNATIHRMSSHHAHTNPAKSAGSANVLVVRGRVGIAASADGRVKNIIGE